MFLEEETIKEFIDECLSRAQVGATSANLVERYSAELQGRHITKSARALSNWPEFGDLETSFGKLAWDVMLNVDLRNSSSRAIRVGVRSTFLTMHTYLPTMAKIASDLGGDIVGLRGDGLIAAFGLLEVTTIGLWLAPTELPLPNSLPCSKLIRLTVNT